MLSVPFLKKLTQYSSAACPVLALPSLTNAQVLYSDIDPDYVLTDAPGSDGTTEAIDLNNDGVSDFVLAVFSSVSNGGSLQINRAGAQPYASNGNGILGFSLSGSSLYVSALQSGAAIDSTKNFWNHPGYYGSMVWYSLSVQGTFGQWNNAVDKYMGVKFLDDTGNLHYGWIRMDVQNNPIKIVIKDFAYEQTPDKGIYAGSTISLGQNQIESHDDFNIFAFNNNVFIQSPPDLSGPMKIMVMGITGQILHEETTDENNIQFTLNNYPSGIYVVTVMKGGQKRTGEVSIQ